MIATILKLKEGFKVPTKGSANAVGYDLYTPENVSVPPSARVRIPMGFALEMPSHTEAKIEPRSGFASKGIVGISYDSEALKSGSPRHSKRFDADVLVGKIDPDYRGEVSVIVRNNSDKAFIIRQGTRIAQMTFYSLPIVDFILADRLSDTERGSNGFGSSGID